MNSVKGETSFTANITAARGRGNILPPHVDGWGGGARIPYTIEEETDRREGKGSRCRLGDRIPSIPCRTTYLAPG